MDASPIRLLLALALAGPVCARADGISQYGDPNWKPDMHKSSPISAKSYFGRQSSLGNRQAEFRSNAVPLKSFPVGQSSMGGTAAIGKRTAKLTGAATLPQGPDNFTGKTFAGAGRSAAGIDKGAFPTRTNAWSGKAAGGLKGDYATDSYAGKVPKELSKTLAAYQKPNLTVEEVKELLNVMKHPQNPSAEVKPEAGLPLGKGHGQGVEAHSTGPGGGGDVAPSGAGPQRKSRGGPGGGR